MGVGERAGVICEPAVRTVHRQPKDNWEFLLLCTDAVWDKMSTQEALDIVGKHKHDSAQRAAENLAAAAWNRWIEEEENVVDDITVLCFFFKNEQRSRADAEASEKKKGSAKSRKQLSRSKTL